MSGRRPGSIRERPRGSGRWELRYDGPPDASGHRKQVSKTIRGTKRAAEIYLRERLAAMENGSYVPNIRQTVAEFLQEWLSIYAATNTSPRTQQGYRGNIQRYIVPAIGGVRLQSLQAQHIQKMYAHMLENGLSARTVLQTHRVLRQALGHAVKWELRINNPADAATPPRPDNVEIAMWGVDTIHRFLKVAQNGSYGDFYHVALHTGLRRSELCGLMWQSVDLDRGKLMVVKTLQRIYGKGLVEGLPKTVKSRRSLALSRNTVTRLRSVKVRQAESRLAAGPAWTENGYVFTRPDGRPIDPDAVTHNFKDIVRDAELPHLTLHGLRHAYATLLLSKGVHLKVVSEMLGHSNISVTADIYSHVLPSLQENAAQELDSALDTGT